VRDEHFMFHMVVYRHYSGEVENVYITVKHVHFASIKYSGFSRFE